MRLDVILFLLCVNGLRFHITGDNLTSAERDFLLSISLGEVEDANAMTTLGAFLRRYHVPTRPISTVPSPFLQNHLARVDICGAKGNVEAMLLSACIRKLSSTFCYERTGEQWDPAFLQHLITLHPSPHFEHRLWFVRRGLKSGNLIAQSMLYLNHSDPIDQSWRDIILPYISTFAPHKSYMLSLFALYNAIPIEADHGSMQMTFLRSLWRIEWPSDDEFTLWTRPEQLWETMINGGYFEQYYYGDSWSEYTDRLKQYFSVPWNRKLFESSLCIEPTESGWKRLSMMLIPLLEESTISFPCQTSQMVSSMLSAIFKYEQVENPQWLRIQVRILSVLIKRFPFELDPQSLQSVMNRLWNVSHPNSVPVRSLLILIEDIRSATTSELLAIIMKDMALSGFAERYFTSMLIPTDDFSLLFLRFPLLYLQSEPAALSRLLSPWLRYGVHLIRILKTTEEEKYKSGLLMLLKEKVERETEFLEDLRAGNLNFQIFTLLTEDEYVSLFANSSPEFIDTLNGIVSSIEPLSEQMSNLNLQ